MVADEEETEEEEEGSEEDNGREREARPAEEDEQGGEDRDLGASSGGRGLVVGGAKAWLSPAPWVVDRLEGLEAVGAGLVWEGQSSTRKDGSGVLQLLSTV